ncbi:MAG: ABC transporter permease, partial [Gammaproteobacteria bacterium]|nr:ABC transporter permease [Gammaproteobacteria bacterium]
MSPPVTPPSAHADPADPARLRLQGRWTLRHTELIGQALEQAPDGMAAIDVTSVERLGTLGVLRLIR